MKKIIKNAFAIGITGTLLISALGAYAQVGNNTAAQQMSDRAKQMMLQAQERVKKVREDLNQKIGKVRDRQKQQMATRISEMFDRMNKTWTDHFNNVLDHLEVVLAKIKSRTQKAESNGQDVLAVKTAIQDAEAKIAAARTAVSNQAQKTYPVNVMSVTKTGDTLQEQSNLVAKLRDQFKAVKDQLLKDLFSLRDGPMKDARTAVQSAMQALAKVPNVDKEPASE